MANTSKQLESTSGYSGLYPPGLIQSGTPHVIRRMQNVGGYRYELLSKSRTAVNETPLFAMTGGLKNQATSYDDPEIVWTEERYEDFTLTLVAAYPAAESGSIGTVTVFGSVEYIHEFQLLKNHDSGEVMQVRCAPAFVDFNNRRPVQLEVTRGFAGTAAVAYDPLDPATCGRCGGEPRLGFIGTAFHEFSCNVNGFAGSRDKWSQYMQISRAGIAMTGTARATKNTLGNTTERQKMLQLKAFNMQVEGAMLFGEKSIGMYDGRILRTTAGIIPQIRERAPENYARRNPDSKLGLTEFEDLAENIIFRYGSKHKVAFVGRKALRTLRHMVRFNSQKLDHPGTATMYKGMRITRFELDQGILDVMVHPLFDKHGYPWDSAMLTVDLEELVYLNLKGRGPKWQKFQGDDRCDGMEEGILAEYAAIIKSAATGSVIFGLCEAGEDCFTCADPMDIEVACAEDYCDPCDAPRPLDEVTDPFCCQTCGGSSGCGCGGNEGASREDCVNETPQAENSCDTECGPPPEPVVVEKYVVPTACDEEEEPPVDPVEPVKEPDGATEGTTEEAAPVNEAGLGELTGPDEEPLL